MKHFKIYLKSGLKMCYNQTIQDSVIENNQYKVGPEKEL